MLWNVHAWDVREGGAISVSLDFGGKPYEVRGEFLVVEPPSRLRYRWNDDQSVDVTIEPRGAGSLLRLEHRWPPTDEDRSMIAAGWTSALEQLQRALGLKVHIEDHNGHGKVIIEYAKLEDFDTLLSQLAGQ